MTFLLGYDLRRPGFRSFRLALLTSLFACLLALACFASSAHAGDRIYWTNQFAPNKISFANLDGSGGATQHHRRGRRRITWRGD